MVLAQVEFIPIPPGPEPGYDHADVFQPSPPGTSRLYVAHTGADCIEVIDCDTNTYLHRLSGLPAVAGVLIDSEQDRLFSSDRGRARISVYRCSDEQLLGQVAVGPHPNGLAYDPGRRRLFVFNLGDPPGEHCTLSVVALEEMQVIKSIPLPGRPRWAVFDGDTDRVYANVRAPAQVIAVDANSLRITRAYHVPAAGPHGLALSGNRLFCAADAGELVVLSRDTGDVLGAVSLAGEPDVIMHDPALGRLYVAVGVPGVVNVVDLQRLQVLETVPTGPGAHTIGYNPDHRTLFAFLPAREGAAVFVER